MGRAQPAEQITGNQAASNRRGFDHLWKRRCGTHKKRFGLVSFYSQDCAELFIFSSGEPAVPAVVAAQ